MNESKLCNPKVHFFCLGVPRAGTTWLYELLKSHPLVFLPEKEHHFFTNVDGQDLYAQKGLSWLKNKYAQSKESQLRGDIAAGYFRSQTARDRLFDYSPDAKLIVMLRNPVDRTFSDYRLSKGRKRFSGDFEEFIADPNIGYRSLEDGLYAKQLERWLTCFDIKQFHFILMDEIIANPEKVYSDLCSFLDLPEVQLGFIANNKVNQPKQVRFRWLQTLYFNIANQLSKSGKDGWKVLLRKTGIPSLIKKLNYQDMQREKLDPHVKEKLVLFFKEDIKKLEVLTGKSLSGWI
ncbi:sulfotransferase family protein [Alloalcanivorax marinus]|uniref:sulfotransferase family protein n=1 Tax=Alloalcanivorax marinus TaxID=1177169 RepID=UPI00195A0088|nr:sulfotransferase [Alloalcanivorax marinus]MBM7333639.1 sulfotransferase [Alloalcanivorax marinus]